MAFSASKPGGAGLHRPMADINVTPLVDVMLVLLIVFMVTAPLMTTGLKVNLPQAKAAQPLKPQTPIVLSVTPEGKFALGTDEVDMESLIPALEAKMEGDRNRVIQLRADKAAVYGTVIVLIDKLVSNGITRIALVSDPKSRTGSASAVTAGTRVPQTSPAPSSTANR